MWDVSHSLQVKKDLQKELPDMENITNREEQFHLTSSDIEERKIALQKLPFDELAQMFRIQEGIDHEAIKDEDNHLEKRGLIESITDQMAKFGIQEGQDPEAMKDEVNELEKDELIDSIIDYMGEESSPCN